LEFLPLRTNQPRVPRPPELPGKPRNAREVWNPKREKKAQVCPEKPGLPDQGATQEVPAEEKPKKNRWLGPEEEAEGEDDNAAWALEQGLLDLGVMLEGLDPADAGKTVEHSSALIDNLHTLPDFGP